MPGRHKIMSGPNEGEIVRVIRRLPHGKVEVRSINGGRAFIVDESIVNYRVETFNYPIEAPRHPIAPEGNRSS